MHKQKIIKILQTRIAYHFYFWVCIFCFMSLNHLEMEVSVFDLIKRTVIFLGLIIIPVYIHFFVFEKYCFRKRYVLYILFLIIIISGYVFVKNIVAKALYDADKNIFRNIYLIFTYLILTTSLKIGKAGFEQKLLLQNIKAQHLKTELELLKSQINPHFLFNTLNNLFGLVRKLDENVAGGIAQLSHLMRYMIYESNVEKIDLVKEVEQIRRLIELQKLRISKDDDVAIHFRIEGDIQKVQIPPMLLIPFVENAFKHGILLDASSFIDINLTVQDNTLQFRVRNSVHAENQEIEEANTGLGLRNVKRRLELLFQENYEFKVQETNEDFGIKLTLTL